MIESARRWPHPSFAFADAAMDFDTDAPARKGLSTGLEVCSEGSAKMPASWVTPAMARDARRLGGEARSRITRLLSRGSRAVQSKGITTLETHGFAENSRGDLKEGTNLPAGGVPVDRLERAFLARLRRAQRAEKAQETSKDRRALDARIRRVHLDTEEDADGPGASFFLGR